MSLLTIIIPVYNGEKYIRKALNSVFTQGILDYEVIIVNDGSIDSTLTLSEEVAKSNSKVRIYTQENKGASVARNVGISMATGKYIAFLDADDQFVHGCFAPIKQSLSEEEFDILMFSSLASNVERNRYRIDMRFSDCIVSGGHIFSVNGHFGACLYRRKFLLEKNISFAEGVRLNEDQVFKLKALYSANTIRTMSAFSYIYNATPGSIMRTIDKAVDRVDAWQEAKLWFEENGFHNDKRLMEYVDVKINSRMLLYAKSYVQSCHSKKQLLAELKCIGGSPRLYEINSEQVMPYQVKELRWFQNDIQKFIWKARFEGIKIGVGRMLLRITVIRRWRDKRMYPMGESVNNKRVI